MTSLQRSIRDGWVMFIIAAIAVLGIGIGGFAVIKGQHDHDDSMRDQARDLQCITAWADATTARSNFIQKYLAPRNDAQSNLEVAVQAGAAKPEVDYLRGVFIRANAKYSAAQKSHPLPKSPQFICASRSGVNLPTPESTETP